MQENSLYTGWVKWVPTGDEWADLYEGDKIPFHMLENQYLLVYDEDKQGKQTLTHTYCYEEGKLRKVSKGSINISKKREKDSKVIYPRNDEQTCAIDMLLDESKTIKLLTGSWGTGKTMLLVSAALNMLNRGRYDKIIWIRNNIDVKDTKDLGALPGEAIEKLLPYLGPFIDHVGEEEVRSMINTGSLMVEPLQFLRGRNFENSIIMCSEAENLTKEHIQLIIARAAEGSVIMFDADNKQRDKAVFEKSKGIETMIDRFKGNKLFGYVHLVKGERSATAAMADLLN